MNNLKENTEETKTDNQAGLYTCPMHPQIIKNEPGSCPICGMTLVPMQPSESAEQEEYLDLVKKMKIAVVFTVPVFAIAMIEMIPNNPLLKIMKPRFGENATRRGAFA